MAIPAQPSTPYRWPYSSDDGARHVTRFHRLLPALLSGIAGMVDVIGFLSLGLFTAHVTGNLAVIAALTGAWWTAQHCTSLSGSRFHGRRRRGLVDRQSVQPTRSGIGEATDIVHVESARELRWAVLADGTHKLTVSEIMKRGGTGPSGGSVFTAVHG